MNYKIGILSIVIICVVSLFWYKKQVKYDLVFTCSTYFTKPYRLQQFYTAIDSISDKNMIKKFIVINEYDKSDTTDYKKLINARYPYIEFIQKDEIDKGQARTLNIILDRIKEYKYHMHWEETWQATKPFIKKAITIMDNSDISQLQLTNDWLNLDNNRYDKYNGYRIVKLDKLYNSLVNTVETYTKNKNKYGYGIMWPLYSLRPSINRVSQYAKIGYFSEDVKLWPVVFEYEYAVRWIESGAIKAIIDPYIAIRQPNHISTY